MFIAIIYRVSPVSYYAGVTNVICRTSHVLRMPCFYGDVCKQWDTEGQLELLSRLGIPSIPH